MGVFDYGYGRNVYWLYDCAAEFMEKLPDTVSYEYTDSTYHTVTTKGGEFCAFCFGTRHTSTSKLERHNTDTEILPQPAHGRFATVEHCSLCEYADYDYSTAKAVIADYYGVAYVWLRDESVKDDGSCGCGCGDPDCGCQDKNCGGSRCSNKSCGDNHNLCCWTVLIPLA